MFEYGFGRGLQNWGLILGCGLVRDCGCLRTLDGCVNARIVR